MASRGYYARRGTRAELAFFWRLIWPGFAFIIVTNEILLQLAGLPPMPLWISTPGAIAAMLAVAYWRDKHPTGKVVERRIRSYAEDTTIVHVLRRGRVVDAIVFGGRPNPLAAVPVNCPSPELATAAIIEYVAGDITLERLERDLDFYMLGRNDRRGS